MILGVSRGVCAGRGVLVGGFDTLNWWVKCLYGSVKLRVQVPHHTSLGVTCNSLGVLRYGLGVLYMSLGLLHHKPQESGCFTLQSGCYIQQSG